MSPSGPPCRMCDVIKCWFPRLLISLEGDQRWKREKQAGVCRQGRQTGRRVLAYSSRERKARTVLSFTRVRLEANGTPANICKRQKDFRPRPGRHDGIQQAEIPET